MAYDYSKLNGKIIEVYGTRGAFAEAMEISDRTLSLKLNNLTSWKQPEITKACKLLKLEQDEIQDYFFDLKVQEVWTRKEWNYGKCNSFNSRRTI